MSLKLILGSSSPWRRRIMDEMGLKYEVVRPDIDEKTIRDDDPERLVLALAKAKSAAVRAKVGEPAVIITSDQVVTCAGRVLEKPRDEAEAREFIRLAHLEPSATVTAVCVVNTATGQEASGVDIARIWMKPIPDELAERLICKGDVLTCAGGLEISAPEIQPYIERIEGELESVIGLPKALTLRLIGEVTDKNIFD